MEYSKPSDWSFRAWGLGGGQAKHIPCAGHMPTKPGVPSTPSLVLTKKECAEQLLWQIFCSWHEWRWQEALLASKPTGATQEGKHHKPEQQVACGAAPCQPLVELRSVAQHRWGASPSTHMQQHIGPRHNLSGSAREPLALQVQIARGGPTHPQKDTSCPLGVR